MAYSQVKAKMYDYNCDIKLCVGGANFKAHREVSFTDNNQISH